MGVFSQLRLLLWKNVKLRQRRPILTVTQLGWPILIFVVISILRANYPPKDSQECHFNARAVPSSGILPFMQSMVCDFDSPCLSDTVPSNEVPTIADAQIGKVVEELNPLFQNDTLLESVKALPSNLEPIAELAKVVEIAVKNLTESQPKVSDLFQDVNRIREVFQSLGIPSGVSDAFFNATLDVLEVLDFIGSLNIDNAVCNETFLERYLTFPPGTDVGPLSDTLCNLTTVQRRAIANLLPTGLDLDYIANELEELSRAVEPYTWEEFVRDLMVLQEELEETGKHDGLVNILPQITELSKFASLFQRIFEEYQYGQFERLYEDMAPLLQLLQNSLTDVPWVETLTEVIDQATVIIDALTHNEDKLRDRGIPLGDLVRNATRLELELGLPGDVVDLLLSIEVLPADLPLLFDILEFPNRTMDLICSTNVTQDSSVSMRPKLEDALVVLCEHDINQVVEAILAELDATAVLDELTGLFQNNRNLFNGTMDLGALLNETMDLFDHLRNETFFQVVTDVLRQLENFDLLQSNPWLGLFLNVSMDELFADGGMKDGSLAFMESLLQVFLPIVEGQLVQTPLWEHVQKQLLIQYLYTDLQLQIVEMFSRGSCPDGWHSQVPSCYRYEDTRVDYSTSFSKCQGLHQLSHPVTVNDANEQKFLEEIGEDVPVWLGLHADPYWWVDGNIMSYTNWGQVDKDENCGVANFGADGRWMSSDCFSQFASLCEVTQEHALITLIKNSPQDELTDLILQIGPAATEVLLKEVFSPMFIESLINSTMSDVTFELCTESFLEAITPLVSGDLLTEVCSFDPIAFWEEQTSYWNFPEIDQKISNIISVTLTEPSDLLPSQLEVASFESVISKQIELQETIANAVLVPFNPALLAPDVVVAGTPEEWGAAFERLSTHWNQQLMDVLSGQLSGSLYEEFLFSPAVQEQFAIQEVISLVAEAANSVFEVLEDLSVGNITVEEPQSAKFLTGIRGILKQFEDISTAINEATDSSAKATDFYAAVVEENLFCNAAVRSEFLTLSVESQTVFDEVICDVNYPQLYDEIKIWLQIPDIEYLFENFIPYRPSNDMLPPVPDQKEYQATFSELFSNLMNIDVIVHQYIMTYELTFLENIPTMPSDQSEISVVDLLMKLNPLLLSVGLKMEAITVIEDTLRASFPWDDESIGRILEGISKINPQLTHAYFLDLLAENLIINDLVVVTLSDILVQLTGEVYVFPDDLGFWPDAEEIVKLIPVVENFPDVVQVMLGILNDDEKAAQLFSSDDVRSLLCSDTSFLNTSFGGSVDLINVQNVLCDVDVMAIASEISSLPAVQRFYQLGNHTFSSEFNFTVYTLHQSQLSVAWEGFIANPPKVRASQPWLNETRTDLLRVLTDFGNYQSDPARLMEMESLLTFIDELEMANVTLPSEIQMALQTVIASLSYANDILGVLPGQNITLGDILPSNLAEFVSDSIYYGVDINLLQLQALIVNQDQLLVIAEDGNIQRVICSNSSSLGGLLVAPPEVNLTAAHQVLCSLNETAVAVELTREVAKIREKAQVERDIRESMAIVESFISNVAAVLQLPPNFVRFDEEWFQMNAVKWEAAFKSLEEAYNTLAQQNRNDFGVEMLFNVLQKNFGQEPWFQPYLYQIRMEDFVTSILLEKLTEFEGKNISYETLDASLDGFPTLQEVLTFREVVPDMVDALLALSSDQNKVTQFFSSPSPFATACASGRFQYFFQVPENSTTDVAALETKICDLNRTALFIEVDRYLGLAEIKAEYYDILWNDPNLPLVNLTAVYMRQSQLESVIAELVMNPPVIIIDEELWHQATRELEAVLAYWQEQTTYMFNPSDPTGDLTSLLEMINQQLSSFENDTWYQEAVKNQRLQNYINTLILDWLNQLQGKTLTLPTLDEIFGSSQNIQELLRLTDLAPDVIEAFLTLSLQQDKWTSFVSMPTPITTLCASGGFTQFFQLPPESTSNITAIANVVCSVNITAIDVELKKVIGLTEIEAEIMRILYSGPTPGRYNWTASYLIDQQLQAAIRGLLENPPSVTVDPMWWNETQVEVSVVVAKWLQQLQSMPITSTTSPAIIDIIEQLTASLEEFANETWYQDVVGPRRINDLINSFLIDTAEILQGQILTLPRLEEVFGNTTYVKELLALSDLTPEIVEAFLGLTLQMDKWNAFWTMTNPIATICASGEFTNFFQLPPDSASDIDALSSAICSVNITAVDKELTNIFNLDELLMEFSKIIYNDPSLGPYNWTASYILSQRVSEAFTDLVANPPDVRVDFSWWNRTISELEAVLARWSSIMNSSPGSNPNMNQTLEDVIRTIEEQLSLFQNETWYMELIAAMRAMDFVNQFVIDWANRLTGQPLTLPTLDEIFGNTTHVRQLLSSLSGVTPDVVDAFLSLSLQQEKWESFWIMESPITTLCTSGEFESFFELPPDSPSNITAVSTVICSVNLMAIDAELREVFMLNQTLMQVPLILYNQQYAGQYNWTASYQLSLDVQQAIEDLVVNPPQFWVDPIWLNETRSDLLEVIERWWNAMLAERNDPTNQLTMFLELLESQFGNFQNESWYQEIITQMRLMDHINQIIINFSKRLAGTTIIIPKMSELFQNSSRISELLGLQDIAPELVDVFLSLSVQPEKWEMFWSLHEPLKYICGSGNFTAFFALPPGSTTDIALVEDALCSIDTTGLDEEFREVFGLDKNTAKIALILANDPSLGPYNWTASYILSMQVEDAIASLLHNPFYIEVDPVWWNDTRAGFLEVLQQWSQRFNEMINPGGPSGAFDMQRIFEMFERVLAPVMGGDIWLQAFVRQMRVMDAVNQIILRWTQELKGTTITLPYFDGLLDNSTHVQQLLALQDLTPEFIEVVLSLSMYPEKFAAFFELNQPLVTVCREGSLADYFYLPEGSSVDLSEVQTALCSINLTAVELELKDLIQLDFIELSLMPILYNDPSLGPYNWTASMILSQQVQDAVTELLSGPPIFEVDQGWLNSTHSLYNELLSTFNTPVNLETSLDRLEASLRAYGIWDQVELILNVYSSSVSVGLAIAQAQVDEVRITLDANIPPEVAGKMLSYTPEELQALAVTNGIFPTDYLLYFYLEDLWETEFCNDNQNLNSSVQLRYPPSVNSTALNKYFCDIGPEQYFQDLEALYGYNLLDTLPVRHSFEPSDDFDWGPVMNVTEEAISLLKDISKLPASYLKGRSLGEIFDRLSQVQLAILEEDIESAIESLELIADFFNEGSYVHDIIQEVRTNVVAVDRWMNFITSENETALTDLPPVSICEMFLPVLMPFSFDSGLVFADVFMQVVNQLFFGLPEYEEEIQALLNDQTLVNEFLLTASSVSTDISTSWEVIRQDRFQFSLLRLLSLDIIEGKLGEATCSPDNLSKLLGVYDPNDIEALSTFICSSNSVIQTDLVQKIFAVIDFDTAVSKLRTLTNPGRGPLPEASCTSLINNGQEFFQNVAILFHDPTAFQLNLEIPGLMHLVDEIFSVIENATRGEIADLDSLLDALEEFSGGDIFDESTVVLIHELIDQYELYLDSLNQQTGLIPVYSLWYNSSDVAALLSQETGMSPQNVTMLLNGYLNSTQISELTDLTVVTWSRVICEEGVISRLLVLPSEELEALVYRETCQHPNKEKLFQELQQMFSLFNFLRETAMSSVPRSPSFAEFLLDIIARVEGQDTSAIEGFLEETLPALQDVDDVTDLVELIPDLDNITVVLDSFEELFANLEPVLGGSPLFQQAKGLLESLIEKQYIVDVFKEIPDLTIRKLLQDPDGFLDFLEDNTGIDQKTAESIVDSALRIEVLLPLGPSKTRDEICSEEFFDRYLVFVDGTNVTAVVETLCREGSRDPVKIMSVLLSQLNLTESLESLTSTDITEIFTDMTGSLSNITVALEGVQTLQESLPQLLESTSSLEGVIGEDTIERVSRGDTAALFEDNPELFCGGASQQSGQTRKRRQAPQVDSSEDFCEEFYERLQDGEYGDLQFAYLKPILLGKIFYTPDNPVTRKIIQKVNRPFQDILNLQVTAQAWLDGVGQLTDLLSSEGLEDIQRLVDNAYVSQLLEAETELDAGSLGDTLSGDISSLPVENVKQFTVLAELVVNFTKCIDLDRFVGFHSETELEEQASSLNVDNLFLAAIQFHNLDGLEEDSEIPKHVKYALRMDSDRTPTTRDLMNVYWFRTGRTNFATEGQYLHGYVFLQDLVERAIIELHADSNVKLSDVYIQQMPYPCHQNDRFLLVATLVFPLLFTVGFLVLIAVMTHQLVYEKERGIEELMKVMGLQSGINWLAWFIVNAVLLAALMLVISIIVFIGGLIIHSKFLLVFLFFLCYGLSLIMMSYMSSSFFHKSNIASLGSVLIYFFLYLPFGFVYIMRVDVSRAAVYLMSLSAPTAFCFGSLTMTRYEHQGIGANWENAWENPRYEDVFNMAGSCLMLLLDSLIYFLIGWYVRTVFPGKYGVRRKWYFPFQSSYWLRQMRRPSAGQQPNGFAVNSAYPGDTPLTDMGAQVEAEPQDRPIGIAINNLSKIYDTRCSSFSNKALDEMTLNVFEGQVTALLGSNGAGKTTTISIITGMFPASSGSVSIYGKQVGKAGGQSNDLGLCPQHNALYEELTVKEHLMIYGKLQGMASDDIKEHGVNLLEDLQLMDMLQVPVRNLSGGMKRKLCVAMSMVGDAKTVILDEPTSGVDPHARRAVWDLIIRSKPGRTIILCTHFMDEADLLGDRIAILDRGKLRCCGSSGFLKSKYTSGVKLTLTKERPSSSSSPETVKKVPLEKVVTGNEYSELPTAKDKEGKEKARTSSASSSTSGVSSNKDLCDSSKVTAFLTSKADGIKLIKDVGSELVYQLPSSPEEKAKYPQLFRDLDKQLNDLHIRNYGVSDTKLEEVFLKVSTHSDSYQESNVDRPREDSDNGMFRRPESQLLGVSQKDMYGSSFTKVFQQFTGVLLKRFHITRRDWRAFIWAVLMPVVFLTLGTVMTLVSPKNIHPELQLTPAMFKDPNYVFFSNGETESVAGQRLTEAFLNAPGIGTTCMSDADQPDLYPCTFRGAVSQSPLMDLTPEEKREILEEDLNSPQCVCTDNSMSECPDGSGGAVPPHWVTNTSAFIQDLSLKRDINDYILNTRHIYQRERYGGLTLVDVDDRTVLKAWYSNIGHHALPTYINVANNVLLRASVGTQSNPAEYGITAYNYPLELAEAAPDLSGWLIASAQFGLLMFVTSALALIPSTLATLMVQENINGAKRLHFVSGATPLTYWFTNLLWDWLVYLVPVTLMVIVLAVCNINGLTSADNLGTFILLLLLYGFAILTQYYCLAPFFGDPGTAFVVYFCGNLLIFIMTNLPSFLNYLQVSEPLAWVDTLGYVFLIFTPYSISSAILRLLYNQLEVNFYMAYGVPTQTRSLDLVKWNVVSMLLQGVIAFSILILVEHLKRQRVKCITTDGGRVSSDEDEDVEEERKRVAEGGAAEDIISLKDVTKVYQLGKRRITAVDHISLGVPRGECFGLLGVNGAGKTTLFRTITTDLQPSDGTITVNTKSIGYCPQMDAIYDQMTGEEILFCYARVKGIDERHVAEVVADMVSQLQMQRFVGDVISTYSGGMKRTLSVAIALLGNPELVLMDEPTSGMDPVSKQTVWRCIQAIIMEGRSVIVTSHSMEECENLCTRLAIMVNGNFRCLGSPQHVKHRHGEGYTLILHLLSGNKPADIGAISQFMNATFPNNVLKEHHLTMLRYQLSADRLALADIYEAVESKRTLLGIEDYSVTQTTLDQVFVNFAKRQKEMFGDDTSSTSSLGNINQAFDPDMATVV